MAKVEAMKCEHCGKVAQTGGAVMPKGWLQATVASAKQEKSIDVCGECKGKVTLDLVLELKS